MKNRLLFSVNKILPIVLIIVLVSLLFGKTLFPAEGKIIYGGDLERQFYFWKGYLKESLKSGFIPFWNPYNFSGTPFLAHPSTAFFYPSTLLFLFLPLNTAFSWNYFLHFVLAGIGMYYLGKSYGNKTGGFASACIFILSGFFSSRIYAGHVDILTTAAWIPWVFLSTKNFLEKPTKQNWLFFIVILSLEILAGYQTVVIFTLELILLYTFYRRLRIIKYLYIFLGILISFAIAAIQILPTFEFVKLSIRSQGLPYDVASWGAFPLSGLKLFVSPFDKIQLSKLTYGYTEGPLTNFFGYYIGTIPLLIVIVFILLTLINIRIKFVAILINKLPIDLWFYFIGIIFFWLISLAYNSWFNIHRLLYNVVPFYRFFRIPAEHLIMVVFLMIVSVGIIIGRLKLTLLKYLLIILIIFQLFSFSRKFIILTDIPDYSFDKKLIQIFKQDNSLYRILPDFRVSAPLSKAFDFNAASIYRIYSTSGYDPMILLSYYRYINLINGVTNSEAIIPLYNVEIPPADPTSKFVNLLNSKYIYLGSGWLPETAQSTKFYQIMPDASYALYRNDNALARFFFVPSVKTYSDNDNLISGVLRSDQLSNEVHLTQKEAVKLPIVITSDCNITATSKIEVISYKPNKIVLKAQSWCDGYLSSSEVYYPGWRAKVDNVNTDIVQSNLSFRTIYLPKGDHLVEIYYQPTIYYMGAVISIIAVLILIILLKSQFLKI